MVHQDLDGVSKPRFTQENITPPINAGAEEYDFPSDFHTNYIILDLHHVGETDITTLVEKLAKLGTFDIKTKSGLGQWITNIDFNDQYYYDLIKYWQGGIPFLVGAGGGDNDLSSVRVVIDGGSGGKVSSKVGWNKDDNAKLRINWGADGATQDENELHITWVGYEGIAPRASLGIKSLTPTLTSGQEIQIKPNGGDILQSIFGFMTTELDLATLQATTAPSIEEFRIFGGKKHLETYDIFSCIDNMLDIDDANVGQYIFKDFDPASQGIGLLMENDPAIEIKAGTAGDAVRLYLRLLERR